MRVSQTDETVLRLRLERGDGLTFCGLILTRLFWAGSSIAAHGHFSHSSSAWNSFLLSLLRIWRSPVTFEDPRSG